MAGERMNGDMFKSWGTLASVVIAIVALFLSFANPHTDLQQLETKLITAIDKVEAREETARNKLDKEIDDERRILGGWLENRVTVPVFVQYKDEIKALMDSNIAEINKLRQDQVPRADHEIHWRSQDGQIVNLTKYIDDRLVALATSLNDKIAVERDARIEAVKRVEATVVELQKQFGSISPATDQFKDLRTQLDQLRGAILTRNSQPHGP